MLRHGTPRGHRRSTASSYEDGPVGQQRWFEPRREQHKRGVRQPEAAQGLPVPREQYDLARSGVNVALAVHSGLQSVSDRKHPDLPNAAGILGVLAPLRAAISGAGELY